MRLNRDDDELTRYRKAITADEIAAAEYRAMEAHATKPDQQRIYRTSAESRERMIATYRAKVKELEAVTR
jgi:hypothetical protein